MPAVHFVDFDLQMGDTIELSPESFFDAVDRYSGRPGFILEYNVKTDKLENDIDYRQWEKSPSMWHYDYYDKNIQVPEKPRETLEETDEPGNIIRTVRRLGKYPDYINNKYRING